MCGVSLEISALNGQIRVVLELFSQVAVLFPLVMHRVDENKHPAGLWMSGLKGFSEGVVWAPPVLYSFGNLHF